MLELALLHGWPILAQVKTLISSLSGLITFLAASCCLDAIQAFLGTSQADRAGHEVGRVAGVRNGGNVKKEAFIANLVANMTVPELGELHLAFLGHGFAY